MSKRSNGEGSIWQRKDGRWCGAYFVPKPAGRVRKYVYGRSRKEVYDQLTKIASDVSQGLPVPVAGLTVGDYLDEWVRTVAAPRVRPSTLRAYDANIRLHIKPRIGRKKLGRLTARDVRLMLDELRKDGGGTRVVQYVHATLRVALEHAVREDLVPRNVAKLVQVARPERPDREPLSVEEAQTLLKAAADDRLSALYVVTLLLGVRRSEALALRWADLNLEDGVLTVRGSLHRAGGSLTILPPKTRGSRRTVPLPPMVVAALTAHQARQVEERQAARREWPDNGFVFTTPRGTPIEPRNFTRMFKEVCEAAGVRSVRLHDLRHTCVSLLLALGIHPRVVMEIVGHNTLEMTMNVYGHVSLGTQRQALGELDALLSGRDGTCQPE